LSATSLSGLNLMKTADVAAEAAPLRRPRAAMSRYPDGRPLPLCAPCDRLACSIPALLGADDPGGNPREKGIVQHNGTALQRVCPRRRARASCQVWGVSAQVSKLMTKTDGHRAQRLHPFFKVIEWPPAHSDQLHCTRASPTFRRRRLSSRRWSARPTTDSRRWL